MDTCFSVYAVMDHGNHSAIGPGKGMQSSYELSGADPGFSERGFRVRSQDFSLGGVAFGRWAVKIQTCRGVRGHHVLPGKILEILDCWDYISRVFMMEKGNVE